MRIDLDQNATTAPDPRVRDAMVAALDGIHGNPSSVHEAGRRAREAVELARAEVAALVGGRHGNVVFTSGGTEADTLGLVGAARAARAGGRPARVVVSPLEHPAVLGAAGALRDQGFEVVAVAVDAHGRIDLESAARALAQETALAAFALANHELGNVFDVGALARLAHAGGALVHCDAVQAAGKMSVDVEALGVDLLAISGHKMHGPKGVGALWVRSGVELAPPFATGHQERGLRPGTENVAGIVGMGVAARLARQETPLERARIAALRERLERGLAAIPGARLHGDLPRRVPNTTNAAFSGVPGSLLVMALDLEGVAVSTGAACTSGTVEPSHVLEALGQSRAQAGEAIRLSLGRGTTEDEVDRVLTLLPPLVRRIRAG